MAQVRLSVLSLAAITAMFSVQLTAQSGDPLFAIQQKLRSQVQLTRTTADRSDIVRAGSVVELQTDGLMMYGVSSPLPPSNTYKNGKISQGLGGFGKDLLISMGSGGDTTAEDYPHRKFVAGEKCWVTGIAVQKDGIVLQLFSDPYDDGRYYASLKIVFPKGPLPVPDAALQIVTEVLTAQPFNDQSSQAVQPVAPAPFPGRALAPGRAVAPNRPAPAAMFPPAASAPSIPAADPLPLIAPPPAASDVPPAPPRTIAMGQTQDQVTALFGQPAKVAKLGPTEIFYYQDMKVTFTNGKVSNVE
jgi:hypothetical protein